MIFHEDAVCPMIWVNVVTGTWDRAESLVE